MSVLHLLLLPSVMNHSFQIEFPPKSFLIAPCAVLVANSEVLKNDVGHLMLNRKDQTFVATIGIPDSVPNVLPFESTHTNALFARTTPGPNTVDLSFQSGSRT